MSAVFGWNRHVVALSAAITGGWLLLLGSGFLLMTMTRMRRAAEPRPSGPPPELEEAALGLLALAAGIVACAAAIKIWRQRPYPRVLLLVIAMGTAITAAKGIQTTRSMAPAALLIASVTLAGGVLNSRDSAIRNPKTGNSRQVFTRR